MAKKTTTSGWGLYPKIDASVRRAHYRRDLGTDDETSVLPQGSCRSYGDACLHNRVVSTLPLKHLLAFDPEQGLLRAEAGITIEELIRFAVPRGFFPPVTPGTKFPTLGGCIAADVHGKNHHADGSIAAFIEELEMVLADGSQVHCSRHRLQDLFWATLGGMGLTGFVYAATLRLKKISSAYIQQRSIKTANFAETCRTFAETQQQCTYSVAWIDSLKKGRQLGRGLILLGEHAPADQLKKKELFPLHAGSHLDVPFFFPDFALNTWSMRAFNTLYYHRQWSHSSTATIHYNPYFYPLDMIHRWNRIYGRKGFLQYQIVVPFADGEEIMADVLGRIVHHGIPSLLTVLKTLGPANEGLLSFPIAGHTLALDIPFRKTDIISFLRELNKSIVDAKGRVYLAKDAILEKEDFAAMYPKLEEFKRVKRLYDPEHRFRSRQSDRLGIT